MAPSTRLQREPARRIVYNALTGRAGSRGNPIPLDDTPPPETALAPKERSALARKARGKETPQPVTRARAGAIIKPKEPSKKNKDVKEPKKRAPPVKRECNICASTKVVANSFKLEKHGNACEHFKSTCSLCIQRMVSVKIESRQLAEPELACPVPGCEHVVDYMGLKAAFTNKAAFAEFDQALAHHHLTASPNFIACLSSKCGRYFSIEDCNPSTKTTAKRSSSSKQKIDCPYCSSSLCLHCNRPWHPKTGCSKAAEAEDLASVTSIKTMGAKPCPKCGIHIEKAGGCDHMTCHRCRHDFCWVCLVPYNAATPHLEGCPHGRRNVAVDPRNWAPENLTVEQVNGLIEQARRRLDEPAGAWAGAAQGGWPAPRAAPPRLDVPQAGAQGGPAVAVAWGGVAGFFGGMFRGHNGGD